MVPEISVVVPTFNRPSQLARCLRAIAEQDYPADRFEVIIVDDGGEVPAAPEIFGYAGKAPIHGFRITNGGPAAARNIGAGIARGRFLAFTDDDCTPSKGWLSALMTRLRHNPEALVGGGIRNSLVENPCSAASQLILDLAYGYDLRRRQPLRFFSSNNMAVSRDLFRDIGGFDVRFRTSEDRDLCDRWSSSGRELIYAPEALVDHANDLNFRSFWRQHLAYGRGAFRFYRAHRDRCPRGTTIHWPFYLEMFRRLPLIILKQERHRSALALLMVAWQAANVSGFLQEALLEMNTAAEADCESE